MPRVHCPEERFKAKEVENSQYTSALMDKRLKLFFAQLFLSISSVFTEQSQKMYEEYETFHDRTGQPVVGGQSSSSSVPRLIKTEVPLDCAHKDLLMQQS